LHFRRKCSRSGYINRLTSKIKQKLLFFKI